MIHTFREAIVDVLIVMKLYFKEKRLTLREIEY